MLAGVEDFAVAVAAPVSMPGYVPCETVSALVLRALSDSQDLGRNPLGDIVLRAPIRAWSSITGVCDLPETNVDCNDYGSESLTLNPHAPEERMVLRAASRKLSTPRAYVREVICALNFQLMQLLRPESMLLGSLELPLQYRLEFVLRQVRYSAFP